MRSKKRRNITRRDFVNGMLISGAGLVTAGSIGCRNERESTPTDLVDDPTEGPSDGTSDSEESSDNPLDVETGEIFRADGGDDFALCHDVWTGREWNLPAASGDLLDCIIIGGGLSGLTTAWKLNKLGISNFVLLEKGDTVGGQAQQATTGTQVAAMASAYSSYPYGHLVELYTDLGIVTGTDPWGEPIVNDRYMIKPPTCNHHINGDRYGDPFEDETVLDELPYSDAVKDGFRALRDDVGGWWDYVGSDGRGAFDAPIDGTTTDANVRALDDITFAEYVASKGWDPMVAEFFAPELKSVMGGDHEQVSAYAAILFLLDEILPSEDNLNSLSWPGGNAFIALSMAELIGDPIRTGAFVLEVNNVDDEVHVSYLDGEEPVTLRAKTAVFAAPRFMAKYLVPEMADRSDEFSSFRYAAYAVANVHVTSTPANLAYCNEGHGDDFFITDFIVADWAGLDDPVNAPLSRANILTAYAPLTDSGARGGLLTQPLSFYEEIILADLERMAPGVTDTVTQFDLYRWGHPLVVPAPGFLFGEARSNSRLPVGNIHFAGHETEGIPFIDNAIMAGILAAETVQGELS